MFDSLKLIEIINKKNIKDCQEEDSIDQYLKSQILPHFQDPEFETKLLDRAQKLGLPSWTGSFIQSYKIPDFKESYSVLAVDGSQIWPDRHFFGSEVALIQAGGALFSYGATASTFESMSKLELILPEDYGFQGLIDRAFVEQARDLYELESAINWAKDLNPKPIIFMDGSFSFLLDRFSNQTKVANPDFCQRFFEALDLVRKLDLKIVFYTSFPSSKAFSKLIKVLLCRAPYFDQENCFGLCGQISCKRLSQINDSILFESILPEWCASNFFVSEKTDLVVQSCFINTRNKADRWSGEIAKVDFFGQSTQVDQDFELLLIIFDQICKGFGYPVGLCQSHEIAVLDENDRQTFKYLLDLGQNGSNQAISQKLVSKKSLKT